MAEDSKKGPVKPPIIDAKPSDKSASDKSISPSKTTDAKKPAAAKPSTSATASPKPELQTAASGANAAKQDAYASQPKSSFSVTTLLVASLVGAALGIAGTSFMAFQNIAPFEKGVQSVRFSTTIEALQKRVYDLENAPSMDISAFATKDEVTQLDQESAIAALRVNIDELGETLTELSNRVTTLSTAEPTIVQSQIDLETISKLQSEIDGLKQSILELSPDNGAAIEAQLAQNQKLAETSTNVSKLSATQAGLVSKIEQFDIRLTELETELTNLASSIAQRSDSTDRAAAAKLPLILDAWAFAITTGAKYDGLILAANQALPALQISDADLAISQSGVATPKELQAEFSALIPALVQLQDDLPADAPWYDRLAAQAKAAIGLRPLDKSGNDPFATVARLESYLAQNDLANAHDQYQKLPENMQSTAIDLGEKLAATHRAALLLEQAKELALGDATENQGTDQ